MADPQFIYNSGLVQGAAEQCKASPEPMASSSMTMVANVAGGAENDRLQTSFLNANNEVIDERTTDSNGILIKLFDVDDSHPYTELDISEDFAGNKFINAANAVEMSLIAAHASRLASLFATILLLLWCDQSDAISSTSKPFVSAPADVALAWIKKLHLENDPSANVKVATIKLYDVSVSATRIESADICVQDICPTFFKYELERTFEFAVTCNEKILILDKRHRDVVGKDVVAMGLLGDGVTTLVTPTSLGPMIVTVREPIDR